MKFLLDENLSSRLVVKLAEVYPGTVHVRDLGMKSALDTVVWEYAARFGLTIITKDADFHHRSILRGHPPKVIWVRLGNCSTDEIVALLSKERQRIKSFEDSDKASFLSLP